MKEKIEALVLGLVRHNDQTDVATLYTRGQGRVSVAVPARPSRRRTANPALMPLSVIEGEISRRSPGSMGKLWRFSLTDPLPRLRLDPVKTAVGMFVAEFLGHLLREQAPDSTMWRAVVTALRWLDKEENSRRTANFHIVMLWHLLAPAGIIPDTASFRTGKGPQWLDMRSGSYTSVKPSHGDVVAPKYASLPLLLARINFRNSHLLRLSGQQRYQLCEALIHYYSVHLPGIGNMHSHHILRDIFNS